MNTTSPWQQGVSEKEALHLVEKYGRDNARTPFQWNIGHAAGFTEGVPWIRVNPNYTTINLEAQRNDPDSVYSYYRKLIRFRKDPRVAETLIYGELIPYLEKEHNVMAYFRKSPEQTILVIANYQREARSLPLPGKVKEILLSNLPLEMDACAGSKIRLEGYQVAVLELT